MSNKTDARDLRNSGTAKSLSELGASQTDVEAVTNAGLTDTAELEAFMHEMVEIYVHKGRGTSDNDVILPNVNGTNQPIVRGQWVPIKRKYVEALARSHVIGYEQKVQDGARPEAIQMAERKVPSYPFDIRDDSRRGKKWIEAIYASL